MSNTAHKSELWRDPIVEETRQAGQRAFETAGGTIDAYMAHLAELTQVCGHPVWPDKSAKRSRISKKPRR